MKGLLLLLVLVVILLCIDDGDAWRRRRWRFRFRFRKAVKYYNMYKAATLLGRKRDIEPTAAVAEGKEGNQKCQMSYYDENNDQMLTREEILPVFLDAQTDLDSLREFDKDGDGYISSQEFSECIGILIPSCKI